MTVERSPLAPTPLIPESFAAKYREAGYWIDQTIPEFLLDACRAKPHFPALVALSHAHVRNILRTGAPKNANDGPQPMACWLGWCG